MGSIHNIGNVSECQADRDSILASEKAHMLHTQQEQHTRYQQCVSGCLAVTLVQQVTDHCMLQRSKQHL